MRRVGEEVDIAQSVESWEIECSIKQSQKECVEPNRREDIVVVRIDGCDPTTAREIYEDRAPERNLPWVANVMGI